MIGGMKDVMCVADMIPCMSGICILAKNVENKNTLNFNLIKFTDLWEKQI